MGRRPHCEISQGNDLCGLVMAGPCPPAETLMAFLNNAHLCGAFRVALKFFSIFLP